MKFEVIEIEILLTILIVVLMLISRFYIEHLIIKYVNLHGYSLSRKAYTNKVFNFAVIVIGIVFISLIWEISFKGLSFYFVSFFTLLGVAFFANWSILRNITASMVLFFNYPFKIGNEVCKYDDEHSKYRKVIDIGLFNIKISTYSDELISYINNIAIQKPIIKNKEKLKIYKNSIN